MASAIQPTSMATPPIGVMAPSHRRPEIDEDVETSRENQGAQQERPARRLERGPAPAGRGQQAHGQDRQGAVHVILRGGLKPRLEIVRQSVLPSGRPATGIAPSGRARRSAPIDTARNPQIAPILIQNPALIVRYCPFRLAVLGQNETRVPTIQIMAECDLSSMQESTERPGGTSMHDPADHRGGLRAARRGRGPRRQGTTSR